MNTKRQASKARGRRSRLARGLTLIEILVVVTILGLIAGIVGVAVVDQFEEARIDSTATQLKAISDSLDLYKVKIGRYPSSTEGLNSLVSPPDGRRPMMERVPKDGWGNDFVYLNPGQHNPAKFDLYSKGSDQQGGTEDDINNWSR